MLEIPTRISAIMLGTIAMVMLLCATVTLSVDFGLVAAEKIPLAYSTLLRLIASILAVAAVAEILIRGGWGRLFFVIVFAIASINIFSKESLPMNFPTTAEGKFGMAGISIILSFGAMMLVHHAESLWKTTK